MKKIITVLAAIAAVAGSLSAKDLVLDLNYAENGSVYLYTLKGGEKQFVAGKSLKGDVQLYLDKGGKTYEFNIKAEGDAGIGSNGKTLYRSFLYNAKKGALQLVGEGTYIKTPAIKGMRLSKITLKNSNMGSGYRFIKIAADEENTKEIASFKSPNIENTKVTGECELDKTEKGTSYYIFPKMGASNICISRLILTYTKK